MDIMLDIETLGTGPRSVVLSVGLVRFDENEIKSKLEIKLNVDEQLRQKRDVTWVTLCWWMNQSDEAKRLFNENNDTMSVKNLYMALKSYIDGTENFENLWSKGSHFDIAILTDLFTSFGLDVPWHYRAPKDMRTLKCFTDLPNLQFEGFQHNAADDAEYQAKVVQQFLNK